MSPQNVDLTSIVHFDVVFDFYAIVSDRPTVVLGSSSELRLKTKQKKTQKKNPKKNLLFLKKKRQTQTKSKWVDIFFHPFFFLFKIFPTEL